MKKIKVVAVGRVKEDYYNQAISEYAKRLSRYAKVEVFEVEEGSQAGHLEREAALLLQKLSGYVCVLDINGTMLDSEGLAAKIDSVFCNRSEITFVIGGSEGLHESVLKKADFCLSFGRITLTHSLARVVLFEQLYRVLNILAGGKYHK